MPIVKLENRHLFRLIFKQEQQEKFSAFVANYADTVTDLRKTLSRKDGFIVIRTNVPLEEAEQSLGYQALIFYPGDRKSETEKQIKEVLKKYSIKPVKI